MYKYLTCLLNKTWNLGYKLRYWFLRSQNWRWRLIWLLSILCFCCWCSRSIWWSIESNLEFNRCSQKRVKEGTKIWKYILEWKPLEEAYLIQLGFHHSGAFPTRLWALNTENSFSLPSQHVKKGFQYHLLNYQVQLT